MPGCIDRWMETWKRASMERKGRKLGERIRNAAPILTTLTVLLATATYVLAWGGTPHSFIVDAALTAIPATDRLSQRLGGEARHLRNNVQMGDWMNSLIVLKENWHVTTEDFPQTNSEYFGNDYLLFPAAPHMFSHIMPEVHGTYTPFFLRSLQALRTEDQANAARWIGSLLHFVTDSGSPPHAISLLGPNHTKMENWLDASKIDLRTYHPVLLGRTDEEAADGLRSRMDGLIARDGEIARRMIPYAEANDRSHVEPLALDCATETAKVTADIIHTLLVLSNQTSGPDASGSTLVASVTAPALSEHPLLPAKLILLGTSFSTLSSLRYSVPEEYSGAFTLTHIPPGNYRAAIERSGSETLFTSSFTLRKGQTESFDWHLREGTPNQNLVQNSDFALRWVVASIPDH